MPAGPQARLDKEKRAESNFLWNPCVRANLLQPGPQDPSRAGPERLHRPARELCLPERRAERGSRSDSCRRPGREAALPPRVLLQRSRGAHTLHAQESGRYQDTGLGRCAGQEKFELNPTPTTVPYGKAQLARANLRRNELKATLPGGCTFATSGASSISSKPRNDFRHHSAVDSVVACDFHH